MANRLPIHIQILIASFVTVSTSFGLIHEIGPKWVLAIHLFGLTVALPTMLYLIVRLALKHHSE